MGVTAAWTLVLIASLGGWCLVERLGGFRGQSLILRCAAGVPVGLSVVGLTGFVMASVLGMRPWTPWVAVALPVVVLMGSHAWPPRSRLEHEARTLWRTLSARRLEILVGLGLAVALVLFFTGAFIETDRGIVTNDHHNLGDLPFHLAIVSGFAYGESFPPEHPELAGVRLTYPFLVDFIAALLVVGGASLRAAFLAENTVLVLALLVALRAWAGALTRDRLAAWLVPLLFLLNGGLGFVLLMQQGYVSEVGLLRAFAAPSMDVTIRPEALPVLGALRWGNVLTTLLLPQRALLLGLPLFLLVSLVWWHALRASGSAGDEIPAPHASISTQMMTAGVIAGLLPLAHAHTLLVLLALAVMWTPGLRLWSRPWRTFFAVAGCLVAPQALWLASGSGVDAGEFLAWHPGWESGSGIPAWFWIANAGLVLPCLLAALLWRRPHPTIDRRLGRFLLPFIPFFVLPNLLRMAPWMWDNVKYLVYAFLGATPVLALLLARLMRRPSPWTRWLGAVLLCLLVIAGLLDVVRVSRGLMKQRIYTAEDVACAALVRQHTPPQACVLHAPTYNSPVYLTGRRSLLGYPGHIFSHGLDAGSREEAISGIYRGDPEAQELVAKHRIDYILLGRQERQTLGAGAAAFSHCRLVAQAPGCLLFDARCR